MLAKRVLEEKMASGALRKDLLYPHLDSNGYSQVVKSTLKT